MLENGHCSFGFWSVRVKKSNLLFFKAFYFYFKERRRETERQKYAYVLYYKPKLLLGLNDCLSELAILNLNKTIIV